VWNCFIGAPLQRGSNEQIAAAKYHQSWAGLAAASLGESNSCAICGAEPDSPHFTSCGHRYCSRCLTTSARKVQMGVSFRFGALEIRVSVDTCSESRSSKVQYPRRLSSIYLGHPSTPSFGRIQTSCSSVLRQTLPRSIASLPKLPTLRVQFDVNQHALLAGPLVMKDSLARSTKNGLQPGLSTFKSGWTTIRLNLVPSVRYRLRGGIDAIL
jgi:Zinc finger, C3HC4 type (RING finger)